MRRISAIVLFAIALFLGSLTVASATTSPDTTDTSTSADPATTTDATATDATTAAPATACSSPSSSAGAQTGAGAGDKCGGTGAAQNPGASDSAGSGANGAAPNGTGAGARDVGFSDQGGSLHLTSVSDKYRQIDLGPKGDSIGDTLAFSDKLFSDSGSHQIGTLDGVCTLTRVYQDEKATRQLCVVTLSMPKGQLTAQGVMRISATTAHDTFPIAITGGTSGYRGASGEAHVTFMSDTRTKIEVDLGH